MGKKKKKKKVTPFKQKLNKLYRVVEYEITRKGLPDPQIVSLPAKVQQEIENVHFMVHENPWKAIRKLKKLIETYPDIPRLYNYLIAAYSVIGKLEKAEALVLESYKKHPDYLFAKLNYAETCMSKGEYEKIPEIFNHKFDLKLLYPERNVFHISEVVNFAGTIGYYYIKTGNRKVAELYYKILNQLEPESPMTQRLKEGLISSESPVD
ncbi:MAG: hypothetical protein E3K32_09505 [wastewater metagenome]|nr:hypothetical protein [Candidatus Loosdrechtia aerotolerans]